MTSLSSAIIDRYARALYKAAGKVLKEEVEIWLDVLNNQKVFSFFINLGINREVKKASLNQFYINPLLKSFLVLLLDNERAQLMRRCLESYLQILKIEEGEAIISITTTIPLSPEEQHSILKDLVEKFTNINLHKLKVRNLIDTSLLGGFIINFNNIRIDYSIRGQLKKFITLSKAAISNI